MSRKSVPDPSTVKNAYVITLQFGHLLIRLAWSPIDGVQPFLHPTLPLFRIHPTPPTGVFVASHGLKSFREIAQLHFTCTVFAEDGTIPPVDTCGDEYVVYDGDSELPYFDDGSRDCLITDDLQKVSVQKIRNLAMNAGVTPIVIFGAKRGQGGYEAVLDGEKQGVFTWSWAKANGNCQDVTFRDAIKNVNREMRELGYVQQAEIVCQRRALDMTIDDLKNDASTKLLFIFDVGRMEEWKKLPGVR